MSSSSTKTKHPSVTGHVYDGIEEYDNPTPGWWTWIFAGSIAFSAVYFLFVMLADGQLSPLGFYDRDLTADAQRQFAQLGEIKSDPASLLAMSTDEKMLRVGGAIFQGNCAACHGLDGAGLTGPNLTDESYIHVQKIGDLVDVISKGRNNGAMPAWENRLEPRQVALLATYVASLRGKNRPGREAQGNVIAPWSEK
jgi:cytochrome c oxidase cbb3-type subunit III